MEITFDPVKQAANKAKHGFDFEDLEAEWFADAVIVAGKFGRFRAVGHFGGVDITVVFKPLGSEALSVISMRPASGRERKLL